MDERRLLRILFGFTAGLIALCPISLFWLHPRPAVLADLVDTWSCVTPKVQHGLRFGANGIGNHIREGGLSSPFHWGVENANLHLGDMGEEGEWNWNHVMPYKLEGDVLTISEGLVRMYNYRRKPREPLRNGADDPSRSAYRQHKAGLDF